MRAVHGGRGTRPAAPPPRQYRRGRGRRVENAVMCVLVAAGLVPHSYLLTTRGRTSGRARHNPVTLVESDGRRWLVAPYGPVPWVLNARAAGWVAISRRGRKHTYSVRDVAPAEAGPVLKRYVGIARVTRPYFRARVDAPVRDFVAEAAAHPVFELVASGE